MDFMAMTYKMQLQVAASYFTATCLCVLGVKKKKNWRRTKSKIIAWIILEIALQFPAERFFSKGLSKELHCTTKKKLNKKKTCSYLYSEEYVTSCSMTTTAVTSSNSQLDCQHAVGCMGTILSSVFPEGQEGKTPLDSETKGQWDVAIVFRRWCVTTGCMTRQLGANSPVTQRLGHLQLAFHCKSKPCRQISALLLSESGKATVF